MRTGFSGIKYHQVIRGECQEVEAGIAVETPVSLSVNGTDWLTFLCMPRDLDCLGLGFLHNEGFIISIDEVDHTHLCQNERLLDVWLRHAVKKPENWLRTSGCGDGKTSDQAMLQVQEPLNSSRRVSAAEIDHCLEKFFQAQADYASVRGIHLSALYDGQNILELIGDVGRHNTLDKLAGRCLKERLDPAENILVTTGRLSSDMVQKAARLKTPVIISLNSTNALAVELAERLGLTLITNANLGRFSVYTHPERLCEKQKRASS